MLAEMGDRTFRLGTVQDDYRAIMMSDQLLGPLWESYTLSVPKCDLCAFEPWCGSDPVFHHTTAKDVVGHADAGTPRWPATSAIVVPIA